VVIILVYQNNEDYRFFDLLRKSHHPSEPPYGGPPPLKGRLELVRNYKIYYNLQRGTSRAAAGENRLRGQQKYGYDSAGRWGKYGYYA